MATTYASSGSERVGYGGGEGVMVGNSSTDLVGFYGTAPIAKATVAATTTTTATTTALQADIDAIRSALQNLGLIG
jgi:hypothetical protein